MSKRSRVPPDLEVIERSMVRIRRHQRRRALAGLMIRVLGPADEPHLAVLDAMDGGARTVGDVARALGLHPSRASRMVGAALRAGYIRRDVAQEDARQVVLVMTPPGHDLLERVRVARAGYFRDLLRGWSKADRADLARLLGRFVDAMETARDP